MDKEKVIQELQERTEEIKEKAGELHKAIDRKSTRLNSSHQPQSRMPSSA